MSIISEAIREVAKESIVQVYDEAWIDGYNEAANICVNFIEQKFAGLIEKIQGGTVLSEREQYLLAELKVLKDDTENKLKDFFAQKE